MEILLIIAGVLLLILNICMIVKFFQIAKDVERLTNLYVDGQRERFDGKIEYYKLPVVEDEEKTKKIEEERKKQQEKIDRMTIYYQK